MLNMLQEFREVGGGDKRLKVTGTKERLLKEEEGA